MSATEAIGVDLGGTKMLVGVVGIDQEVLHRSEGASIGRSSEQLLAALGDELAAAREARPGAVAAGLGVPSRVDRQGGSVGAVNLPLDNVPVRERMQERVGLPVFVDNDANVAALAEYRFGAARGAENAVILTVGTGIGGGLILGGRLYRGSRSSAAELGHFTIELDGPECQGSCPNRGCVEAVASGTAMAREGRAAAEREPTSALGRALAAGEEISGRMVSAAALEGDVVARGVVELIGRRLGVAAAGYANVFDPDVIVFGGGAMAAGEMLLEPAREELRSRALTPMDSTPIVAAQLGPEAGMIGAAAMAIEEMEERR